ncbi:MAG: hypothetical protein JSV05_05245 [Candidatus Bathyarchaeota archaeon]|nr:MAG: hypothetical protein JSV05_05245 [Candidatus Bathyarchaeota archaeon]
MSEGSIEILRIIDDGSTEATTLDAISDHEITYLVATPSTIYVLPTTSVRMRAIAQRVARNMRLANALKQEIQLVGIGERDTLKSALASGARFSREMLLQRREAIPATPEQPIISPRDYVGTGDPDHVPSTVTLQEEVPTTITAPKVDTYVPEAASTAVTDDDYLIRVFAAKLLGAPQKDIQKLLSSFFYSEAQRTIFESKIRRLTQQFIENLS